MVGRAHDPGEQAADLAERGHEAFKRGDARAAHALSSESLALAEQAGDADAIVRALAGLVRVGLRAHEFDEVERLARRCDELAAATGNPAQRRMAVHMRAEAARMQGDLERARALYDESIALNRELGHDAMVGVESANKAWVEIACGQLDDAETLLRTSLEATRDEDAYGRAFCLLGLARVELERGREQGAELLRKAEAVLSDAGLVWDPAEEPEHAATRRLAGIS